MHADHDSKRPPESPPADFHSSGFAAARGRCVAAVFTGRSGAAGSGVPRPMSPRHSRYPEGSGLEPRGGRRRARRRSTASPTRPAPPIAEAERLSTDRTTCAPGPPTPCGFFTTSRSACATSSARSTTCRRTSRRPRRRGRRPPSAGRCACRPRRRAPGTASRPLLHPRSAVDRHLEAPAQARPLALGPDATVRFMSCVAASSRRSAAAIRAGTHPLIVADPMGPRPRRRSLRGPWLHRVRSSRASRHRLPRPLHRAGEVRYRRPAVGILDARRASSHGGHFARADRLRRRCRRSRLTSLGQARTRTVVPALGRISGVQAE